MQTRRRFLETAIAAPALLRAGAQRSLAMVVDSYAHQSFPQQLCDRFRVGYPLDGEWRQPSFHASVYEGSQAASAAIQSADAVLMVPQGASDLVRLLPKVRRGVPVFVAGNLDSTYDVKHISASSWLPFAGRLPDLDLSPNADLTEALIVGGAGPEPMEFHCVNALQALMERRKGGERGVASVQYLEGDAVWNAAAQGQWSAGVLGSALSRSDTPQGLTLKDGRTQDLMAPGLLKSLGPHPKAVVLRYRDGVKANILFIDGAIADYNCAWETRDGQIHSFQFFISPQPNATYSSGLASVIEQFFESGHSPIPIQRALLTAGILDAVRTSQSNGGGLISTPHLQRLSYHA